MSTNNRDNSRFSSLKVFKFSKERPPPPPPKDAQYFPQQGLRVQGPYSSSKSLYNPSVASLVHPTEAVPSLPTTPLTSDYSRTSPVSSQSAPSVRSFAPSGPPMSFESDNSVKPKRSIFKFSPFGKRTTAKNFPDLDSEPQEDEGITRPWNFQHEIHVEEGLVGFPPAWSTALSQAGFTDDEIAAIYARRAATSTSNGTLESQGSDLRSASPLSVLRHPVPRSSSLSKAPSAARSSNTTLLATVHMNSLSTPSPTASSFNVPPSRQSSYIASSSSHSISTTNADAGDTQHAFVNGAGQENIIDPYPLDAQSVSSHRSNSSHHTNSPQIVRTQSDTSRLPARINAHVPSPLVYSLSSPASQSRTGLPSPHGTPPQTVRSAPPCTPPRRVLHVANASDGSPPPAYSSPERRSTYPREKADMSSRDREESRIRAVEHEQAEDDEDDRDSILNISASADTTSPSLYTDISLPLPCRDIDSELLNRHLSPTPPPVIDKRLSEMNTLPPRLSFHFNVDLGLGDWGAGLFSGLEGDVKESGSTSVSGSASEDSSAGLGSGKIASSSKDTQRNSLQDRGGGSSSLLPSFSLSSSRLTRSPSTSSRTPSTPTSCKSHSPSTQTSTPSTSPSPSHSPSELSHSGTFSPTLPDISFDANLTLGAPLHVDVSSSTTRTVLHTPTTIIPPTPKRGLPPIPHEASGDNDREENGGPILPDVSLDPNVSSLGAALVASEMSISTMAPNIEEIANPSFPPAESAGQSTSSERLSSVIIAGKSPAAPTRSLPDPRSGIEVTISLQSPTSPRSNSPSANSSAAGECLAPLTTGNRTSSTLLPERPAGDRDSGMSTMTVTPATIVSVSGAMAITLATASVVDSDAVSRSAIELPRDEVGSETGDGACIVLDSDPAWPEPPLSADLDTTPRQAVRFHTTSLIRAQGSPHSSHFSSETSSTTESAPLVTPKPLLLPPSPLREKTFSPDVAFLTSMTDTFGGRESNSEEGLTLLPVPKVQAYLQRLPSWTMEAVAPLAEFIVDVDPQEYFADLQEIAEGESGSVYAARVVCPLEELGLPVGKTHVAVKAIALQPSISPKLQDLQREMELMHGLHHEHVLRMDAFYVNLVDDSVWIRMELMERSLADVVELVCEGLSLQERMIARFTSDVLLALEYLQKHHIAHRDVRSDNLLLNTDGIVKVADFSNAVHVARNSPTCVGAVGVIYWQAPEMRAGAYNALKVDVWSLGATVWELAQTEPPFADVQDPREIGSQWPPLHNPKLYSHNFHEFLRLCSRPSGSRPNANELLNTPFIRNACGRAVIIQLLSQCRSIEEQALQRESAGES